MENEQNIKWLPKMMAPIIDTCKWCIFHKEIRHKMQDYRYLKIEIEDLLSRDYLGDLVENNNRRVEC